MALAVFAWTWVTTAAPGWLVSEQQALRISQGGKLYRTSQMQQALQGIMMLQHSSC
jgi:hypothetical protein